MNLYAHQLREYWLSYAPTRFAQLESPDDYFEQLGELLAAQIVTLSDQLAGADPVGEGYVEKVARLNAARRQAEEIVIADVAWPAIELSLDDDRAEWESDAQDVNEQYLADWASGLDGGVPVENDIEELSAHWLLPESFVRQLAAAPNPWTFLSEHATLLAASRDRRYERFCAERAAAE